MAQFISRSLIIQSANIRRSLLRPNPISFRYLSLNSARRQSEIYFSKKHEYVKVLASDNLAAVGISDYAQEALGDIVFAQLPEVDDEVKVGEECGALESVKAASEVFSPVSGKVTEKNSAVEETPGLINSSAEDEGWLFKLQLSDPDEVQSLMNRGQYEEYLKSQTDDQ